MAGFVKGKDGKFAGSVGDGKGRVPTPMPVSDRNWRSPAERDAEAAAAAQVERFRHQLEVMRLGRGVDRLLGAEDRLAVGSGLGSVAPADEDAAAGFVGSRPVSGASGAGAVERGPAGAVVLLWDSGALDRHVVAVVRGDGSGGYVDVEATVVTSSLPEAHRMFAGAARECGYMSGSCALCGGAVPCTVGVCEGCVSRGRERLAALLDDGPDA